MASLKSLVERYGFGIKVKAKVTKAFVILSDHNEQCYAIRYEDGFPSESVVLKECSQTNDYEIVKESCTVH